MCPFSSLHPLRKGKDISLECGNSPGSGAIYQGVLFGVAGMFPERFMTAVMSGQALGAVFAAVARIVSLSVGAADAASAFIYFMIAVGVMIITLGCYLYMTATVSFVFMFYLHVFVAVILLFIG